MLITYSNAQCLIDLHGTSAVVCYVGKVCIVLKNDWYIEVMDCDFGVGYFLQVTS